MLAALVLSLPGAVQAGPLHYEKFILAPDVTAGADLYLGALVETWAGDKVKDKEKVTIFKKDAPNEIKRELLYSHADPTLTDTKSLNGGSRDQVIKPANSKVGFNPFGKTLFLLSEAIAHDDPAHNLPNRATALIDVTGYSSYTKTIRAGTANLEKTFTNTVVTRLEGSAAAGKPKSSATETDTHHSADSFAGVYIENAKLWVKDQSSNEPFEALEKAGLFYKGLMDPDKSKSGQIKDPIFMTVLDLDTDTQIIEQIMSFDANVSAADLVIDDTGILMAVDLATAGSSASFEFHTDSSWVVDPYSYSALLDADGLSVSGAALPLAGWQITVDGDHLEAFFPFGPEGQPFEYALVVPQGDFFTMGHEYVYNIGGSGAAVELAQVPEPSSLALALVGALAAGCARQASRRRRSVAAP